MSMQQKNIVIIDDETDILVMLEKFLSRSGYKVQTFNNPVTAISSLPNNTDLVLLDIMMPQMNGLEVLPKLLDKNPKIKVLMMTAYSTLDKVLNAHRHGAREYIMKPFPSLDELGGKIEKILNT